MAAPDISVIIPVYNGDRFLKTAIESVLTQTHCSFELIVIDDGSTDGTAELLRFYRDCARLRSIHQTNQGVSAARNFGIAQARAEVVAFLDADDYFLPHKLARQWALFQADASLGMVHSGWERVDAAGRSLSQVMPWQQHPVLDLPTWLQYKPVLPSAMMFRRRWLEQVGGFDPTLPAAEDVDLVFRLAIAGCPAQWLRQVTTAYRQHAHSAMGDGLEQARCLSRLLDKTFGHPQLPIQARLLEAKVRNGTFIWAAWYLYRTGYPEAMVEYLQAAHACVPTLPTVALVQWVEAFEQFSAGLGEGLELDGLVRSPQWQDLAQGLLGKDVECTPLRYSRPPCQGA